MVLCHMKACGFGCQLHHISYCLIVAYALRRSLVVDSKGWSYSKNGWETVFQPIGTCDATFDLRHSSWDGVFQRNDWDVPVLNLPPIDSLRLRPEFLPQTVPDDLADRMSSFHGDPGVWWLGQFVAYLMRPNPEMQAYLRNEEKNITNLHPIVGVQIRRTDKINSEAAYHSLEEYMTYVEEWFAIYQKHTTEVTRRVFLATDDPNIDAEARKKYPHYIFHTDTSISRSASTSARNTEVSLKGIVHDIYLLSKCDHLVCTFSSQVCRVAYELMQTYHGDASGWFTSLDDVYYFGGQVSNPYKAIRDHMPRPSEIELKVGDLIDYAGNHWDGFAKGKNLRTNKVGLFPAYKVVKQVLRAKVENYSDINVEAFILHTSSQQTIKKSITINNQSSEH